MPDGSTSEAALPPAARETLIHVHGGIHQEVEREQLHRRVEIGGRDGWRLVLRAMGRASSAVWEGEGRCCVLSLPGPEWPIWNRTVWRKA